MGQAYLALYADHEFARLKNEAYEKAAAEAKRRRGRGSPSSTSRRAVGPSLDEFKQMKGEDYMQYLNQIGF